MVLYITHLFFIVSVFSIKISTQNASKFEFQNSEIMTNCVGQSKFLSQSEEVKQDTPNCTFLSLNNSEFTTECLKPGVLRVLGEYGVIRIQCFAAYPIDFFYFGIQPTEAINVTWTKHVKPGTNGGALMFKMEILVRSVPNLKEFYKSDHETRADGHAYSRTGRYIIREICNNTTETPCNNTLLETTYHIFFEEDGVKPTFLRNSETKLRVEGSDLIIPCLSSHYNSTISLISVKTSAEIAHTERISLGFRIPFSRNESEPSLEYKCILKHGDERVMDEMRLVLHKDSNPDIPFGLEELGSVSKGDVEINYKSRLDNASVFHIQPWCRVQNLDEPNTILASVPAHNFAYLRLVREFGLPKFLNRSYTARKGSERVELGREILTSEAHSLHNRFGVTFCQSGNEHKIIEFGTSHSDGQIVKINYGVNWTDSKRDSSDITVFFLLYLEGHEKSSRIPDLFANTTLTFVCRVHEATIVKPTIWYTQRKNGSIIEELIDYNWVGPHSYFKRNMTSDMTRVYCAGSYWYASHWRNISMPLNLIDGEPPVIKPGPSDYVFRPNQKSQILKCEFQGNPRPNVTWTFNGIDITLESYATDTSSIIEFPEIKESHAGIYICKAENRWNVTQKIFEVEVQEDGGVNYFMVIGIPTFVILTLTVASVLYIHLWKKRQVGLSKAEIEEFMKGQKIQALPEQCAHEFAHLTPYTGEHEIHSSKFRIDESSLLGSGAYGKVYKCLLDGVTVAVKTVSKNADASYLKALLSELKIMIYLGSHENVVQFLGSNTAGLSKGSLYIFAKYCPLGSLDNYLRANRPNYLQNPNTNKIVRAFSNTFNYHTLLTWAKQIAAGMNYLGSKKVIHGDLAARNVLLTEDRQVKITDFGLSRQLYDYADYVKKSQEPLPWRWMAIESLRDLTFSTQSDVWAYGVTLWEIFSLGQVPYPGLSWSPTIVEDLQKGLRMCKPEYADESLFDEIIFECWHEVPGKRPSFKQIEQNIESLLGGTTLNMNIYVNQPGRGSLGSLDSNSPVSMNNVKYVCLVCLRSPCSLNAQCKVSGLRNWVMVK